jgi:hypothetical protein
VNVFMNTFKKLGFIEYNDGLTINPSLLTVVVPREPFAARASCHARDVSADRI